MNAADNVFTWDRVSLISSMMDEYDIDFAVIIQHVIHKRAVIEMMTLPFLCLIQRLYDKVGVPEISGVDKKVDTMSKGHTRLIKGTTRVPNTVPQA